MSSVFLRDCWRQEMSRVCLRNNNNLTSSEHDYWAVGEIFPPQTHHFRALKGPMLGKNSLSQCFLTLICVSTQSQ